MLIQQSFYEALTEEFRKLGWLLFELTDTEYGLISLGKTKSWIGLGMSYTDNLITDKGINFDAVDETFDRIHEKFALVSNDEEMIDSALTSQNRLEV